MLIDEKIIIQEIRRISRECRLQSKGQRPVFALLRASEALDSLAKSLSQGTDEDSPFSVREKEVLFHVSQGYTNREIASALSLSEKTIEFHLKAVFRKTETDTRTEAVKIAILKKWI